MNIGDAVIALKNGKHVTRTRGWHGKHFLVLVTPDDPIIVTNTGDLFETDNEIEYAQPTRGLRPFVAIIAANDPAYVTPWVCNAEDLLADDWAEIDGAEIEDMELADLIRPQVIEARAVVHLAKFMGWGDLHRTNIPISGPRPEGIVKYEQSFLVGANEMTIQVEETIQEACEALVQAIHDSDQYVPSVTGVNNLVDPTFSITGVVHVHRITEKDGGWTFTLWMELGFTSDPEVLAE